MWIMRRDTRKFKLLNPTGLFPEPHSIIKTTREDLIAIEEMAVGCGGEEKENIDNK